MYNYKDTIDHSGGASALPAEALQINGIYIEEVVSGYRTLSVSGRESLSAELNTERYGKRDGAELLSRSYPERHITVQYQLMCESPEAFREAYNVFAGILDTQDAQLIFNDEPDKYFIGTPAAVGEVETGKDSVTGTFEIVCTDPHKYAVLEKTVYIPPHTMLPGELTTSSCDVSASALNAGNRPVHPTIELHFHDEYDVEPDTGNQGKTRQIENPGNVAGVTCMTNGAQLKFGNIEAENEPQTFNNAPAPSDTAWDGVSTSDRDNYLRNTLAVNDHAISGALGKSVYDGKQYFGVQYYGSRDTDGIYGPTLSFGTVASNNFNAQCELLFEMTQARMQALESNKERGQFYFGVLGNDTNNNLVEIASVAIDKNSTGKTARWTAKVGTKTKTGTFEMNDKYFTVDTDDEIKTERYVRRATYVKGKKSDNLIQIKRVAGVSGKHVIIYVCGREMKFTDTSAVQASQVLFMFGAENGLRSGYTAPLRYASLARMALRRWKFDMLGGPNVSELNQFTTGDILRIDTENSDFTVDSGHIASYGDIENDYENFVLNPGIFSLTMTSFFTLPSLQNVTPKMYVKYREKWI